MKNQSAIFGRIMRLPRFDGTIPDKGPIHIVSNSGEEYLLITSAPNTPGDVEALASACEDSFSPFINKDIAITGDVLGTILWNAKVE